MEVESCEPPSEEIKSLTQYSAEDVRNTFYIEDVFCRYGLE